MPLGGNHVLLGPQVPVIGDKCDSPVCEAPLPATPPKIPSSPRPGSLLPEFTKTPPLLHGKGGWRPDWPLALLYLLPWTGWSARREGTQCH